MRHRFSLLFISLTCLMSTVAWGEPLTEPKEETASEVRKEMIEKTIPSVQGLHGTPPPKEVPLPSFEARNTENQPRLPKDLKGQPTILWFFPFAATPG